MALKWPDKDPQEILDYPIDLSLWLTTGSDIEATAPAPAVVQEGTSDPGGLTDIVVDNVFVAGKQIVVWLSLGTKDETYTFKATIADNQTAPQKRTLIRRVKIKVKEK